jgi:hypothetical protein
LDHYFFGSASVEQRSPEVNGCGSMVSLVQKLKKLLQSMLFDEALVAKEVFEDHNFTVLRIMYWVAS